MSNHCESCKHSGNCDKEWRYIQLAYPCEKYEHEQTNEEWFTSLSTEEKAKAITHEFYIYPKLLEKCLKATRNVDRINHIKVAEQVILEWLKEKHNG